MAWGLDDLTFVEKTYLRLVSSASQISRLRRHTGEYTMSIKAVISGEIYAYYIVPPVLGIFVKLLHQLIEPKPPGFFPV